MLRAPAVNSFHLWDLEIKFYGVAIFLALLVGLWATYFIAKKYYPKINRDFLLDLFPPIVIGGILGARIYYVLLNHGFYFSHPLEIFAVWHGGLAIHGAVLGGVIAGIIYCKHAKQKVLPYADVISYGLILGQAIGRWGNFFNSEAFGAPTAANYPLGLFIDKVYRPIEFKDSEFFHPTFLYESVSNVIIFLLLFFVVRRLAKNKVRKPVPDDETMSFGDTHYDGVIFFSYLILYSIARFFIELIRIDSVFNVNSIPIAAIVSVIAAVTGVLGLTLIYFKGKQQNAD